MIDESKAARQLGSVLEPVTGQVYFSPECHANYVALGFAPSNGEFNGVAAPDGPAYFTSRGSVLGQVPGTVVAATFGVFNPEAVVPAVTFGWTKTDAATICQARTDGAIAQLERILGPEPDGVERANELLARAVEPLRPEGRSLFAGQAALPLPDDHARAGLAARRHAARVPRRQPHRGVDHGRPRRHRDRPADRAVLGPAAAHATAARGPGPTSSSTPPPSASRRGACSPTARSPTRGREVRESIEDETDRQMKPALDALGDDADELFAILAPWGQAVRDAKGYPASGPHDLADASR